MPEPENPLIAPFETVISPAAKSVDASDRVKLSAMEASFEVSPDDTVDEVIETVGPVPSYVHWKIEPDAALSLPAISVNTALLTSTCTSPSPEGVRVVE